MIRYRHWLLTAALAVAFGLGWLGSSTLSHAERTFDDCVLVRLPRAASNGIAATIVASCRSKFPNPGEASAYPRSLNAPQLRLLTGRAGLSYGNTFTGNMYNGNSDVVVEDVDIAVATILRRDSSVRTYRIPIHLQPLSTTDFRFPIVTGDPGSTYSWSIVAARGVNQFRLSDLLGDTLR